MTKALFLIWLLLLIWSVKADYTNIETLQIPQNITYQEVSDEQLHKLDKALYAVDPRTIRKEKTWQNRLEKQPILKTYKEYVYNYEYKKHTIKPWLEVILTSIMTSPNTPYVIIEVYRNRLKTLEIKKE